MIRVLSNFLTLVLAVLWLPACAGIPVNGEVGGQRILTRVDSEAARYFVADYLTGKGANTALDARIDDIYRGGQSGLPGRSDLKRLSEEFSIDFAAIYFADRIARMAENRRFREIFAGYRRAFVQNRLTLPPGAADYEVVFVPTYLYKRLPVIGSDLAAPRKAVQRAGIPVHFVETVEDGAVEANAEIVAAAIAQRARSGRRLILISASKSGAEVALALTRLGASRTRHVAGWINAVGALQGTPLADERALAKMDRLAGVVDVAGMESLMTERSRRRFAAFRVPDHVLIVNYFGIPFSGKVSSWARPGFRPLAKHGPNDGILLLADMVFPRGITVAELGLDHFLLDRNIDATAVGLVSAIIHRTAHSLAKSLPVANEQDRHNAAPKFSIDGKRE